MKDWIYDEFKHVGVDYSKKDNVNDYDKQMESIRDYEKEAKEFLDVKKMIERHSIDALILGCTELPLILDKDEFGIPFLNTTAIHAESIVNYCIGNET